MEVDAFAKINLFLDIVSKRNDGYHEIVSVMQTLSLRDSLIIKKIDSGIPVRLETNEKNLPVGDTNLVVKAAKRLIKLYNITQPVQITLTKRIPIGAGLGGGSSDCAATLLGINFLFNLNIPQDKLMEISATLGADVPFCVYANGGGGTAIAKGIGEKITPLPTHPHCYIVLACPQVHVSTKEIYAKYSQLNETFNNTLLSYNKFMQAYETGIPSLIAKNLANTFTPVTSSIEPRILGLIDSFNKHNALGAAMTGTGSTVFAYFQNKNAACAACVQLKNIHKDTAFFVTQTIP